MSNNIMPFDVAEHLDSDEIIAEYLSAVIEEGDDGLFLMALGDVARARGMQHVAQEAGVSRESLYKVFREGAKPGIATIMKVTNALGLNLTVTSTTPRKAVARPLARKTKAKAKAEPGLASA